MGIVEVRATQQTFAEESGVRDLLTPQADLFTLTEKTFIFASGYIVFSIIWDLKKLLV